MERLKSHLVLRFHHAKFARRYTIDIYPTLAMSHHLKR